VLVGNELIGANLQFSLRRGLDLLGGRSNEARREDRKGQNGGEDGDGKKFGHCVGRFRFDCDDWRPGCKTIVTAIPIMNAGRKHRPVCSISLRRR
jgi:hypothetical protein